MDGIRSDTAGEQDLGFVSFPSSSLRLLDEPVRKTGQVFSFL